MAAGLFLAACAQSRDYPPRLHWQLESIGGVPFPGQAFLGLGSDSYAGRAPCNSYNGKLERQSPSVLILDVPSVTQSACPALAAEQVYLGQLSQVREQFVPAGGATLVLTTAAGTALRFRRISGGP
ncbi:META domain protein [Roseisalinus antarcticus]|uniref:META domain protein n=2 Tax=Roseisalinus antarcticus TaxID=254357 RepID=A0A1Y5SPB2_9RHOB|nr:META domain protein [Roseisalinus antarcticus]